MATVTIPFGLAPVGLADNQTVQTNLDLINTQFNLFSDGSANWNKVYIGTGSSTTGELALFNSTNSNKIAFQPGVTGADTTYTLPTGFPGGTYVLQSTSTGTMSWLDIASSYAPIGAAYVTIGNTSTLTAERALTGTSNQITVTDNGANSTVVLSLPQDIATTSTPTFGKITHSLSSTGGIAIDITEATGTQHQYLEGSSGTTQSFLALSVNRNWNLGSSGTSAKTGQAAASIILKSDNGVGDFYVYTTTTNNADTTQRLKIDGAGLATFANNVTITGQLNANNSAGNPIHGTNTNDAASTGYVGEYVSSSVSSNTNVPTTGNYGDLTSISLTAGDWLVTGAVRINTATSTATTNTEAAITTTSGNSSSGFVSGENYFESAFAAPGTNTRQVPHVIAAYRMSLSTTTTVYLKFSATYTNGQPVATGSIRATRIR